MKRAFLGLIALAASGLCWAVPINIQVTGTGTGTLGVAPFTNAAFTIRWTVDTADNTLFNPGTPITAAAFAPVVITGQPAATFSSPGVVLFQNSVLGLSQGGTVLDLIGYWPFNGYSLSSGAPFGPSLIAADSVIGQFTGIPTSQGALTFTAMSNITLQITPNTVPTMNEWGLVLLGVALAVLAVWSLRRRRLGRL